MAGECKIDVRLDGQGIVVSLDGAISEDFDSSSIPAEAGTERQPLRIILAGITRLNSSGVREWLRFVRGLTPGFFTLEQCAIPFVQQLSMVFNMAPRESIVSVFLPYFCESCRSDSAVLQPLEFARNRAQEPVPCKTCGAQAIFDDDPEVYFNWLERDA